MQSPEILKKGKTTEKNVFFRRSNFENMSIIATY